MALVLASLAGLTATLLALGVTRRSPEAFIRRRVRLLEGEQIVPEHRSFAERVLAPLVAAVTGSIGSIMPGGLQRTVAARLETAGMRASARRFVTWWLTAGVVAPVVVVLLSVGAGNGVDGNLVVILGGWLALGALGPWVWLGRTARHRTEQIERSLSDSMDLIVTNVESGVGLQAAMINVAQKSHGPLADELGRVIREIGLGRPRDEALTAMARRSGSREMGLFARSVAQAERNGIPIGRVLRSQAAELRERRRQAAREKANTFPLRITLLTVVFIFPTLFLLILGPVVLNVIDFFAG
ncbi:MAG: type II secretion system F family protein [Dehalococcoidia bacterium]